MKQVFPIVAASPSSSWLLGGLAVVFLALLLLFAYLAYSSRNVTFEVSVEGLHIRGDIYGRNIPADQLLTSQAKVLDLKQEKAYQLRWRTNGTGLPGYKAGWFRLYNGEKGLAFVTNENRVVYIPTKQGYALLLSVARPAEFLQALQQVTLQR